MTKIKILVIEDENIVALDLKNQLETLGYEVCAMISSGEEALERVGELKPDLILMDIMLKGELDGVETATKIKESHNIPIIYLTAYSDEKTLKRAKITEPYGYLLKPFEERELHTNIEIGLYRHKAEQRINHLAYYDQLTDLPNRAFFFQEFQKAIKQAQENNTKVAVLFLDLDKFKNVNDSLGHNIGDALLKEVGRRLKSCIKENELVARLGGDEFTVVLKDFTYKDDAEETAKEIISALSEPFEIEGYIIESTPSIGIALYPTHDEDENKLIVFADAAMYEAKKKGGNNYVLYYEGLHEVYNERLMVEAHLREALEKEEFKIVYQPQLDLHTKEIVGLEALLRWENEDLGLVEPQKFIKIAENSGLLLSIGEWVLNTVCKQTKFLQNAGKKFQIAVNISTTQFNTGFLESLKKALENNNFEPTCLILQITESSVIDKTDVSIKLLDDIRNLGVRVCLDDFGSEAISLTNLKNLPLDSISIDPNITREIITDKASASIVEGIINIGHALGHKIVVVGVESDEQIELLKKFRADQMQGYFLSYPVPSELLGTLL